MTIRQFMEVADHKNNEITIFAGDYELGNFALGEHYADEDDILLGDLKIKKITAQENEIIINVYYNIRVIKEA